MKNGMKLYVVMLSCGLFLASGCANRDVVKKDEGMAPPPVAKPAESQKNSVTTLAPGQERATLPAPPAAPGQQAQKNTSASQLQSALDKIYFDFASAELSNAARATLAKNAAVLMKATDARIRIEGNCDEHGSAEYNLALGERRAQVARKYLETLGVAGGRLATVSFGKEHPADQGHDEAAWRKNRRDEFVVIAP